MTASTLSGLSLSDPAAYLAGVPHAEFARRRRESPIDWVDEAPLWRHGSGGSRAVSGSGYWAVTRHSAICTASRQPQVFSSAARGAFLADPHSRQDLERNRQLLINMDGPQHATIRRFLTAAFTPQAVRRLQHSIREYARSIVGKIIPNEPFEVVRTLTAELPLLVLAELLGMPREDRDLMFNWSNSLVGFDDPQYGGGDIDAYKRTFVEASQYAMDLAGTRRRRPGADLVSTLVNCEVDGLRLSDQQFSYLWILLVVAGNESTRHLLSGALEALAQWPQQRGRLVRQPELLSTAVEELLRWVSPIMQFRRTAVQDVELEGRRMAQGDKVVLYYVSANRDERVFEDADRLDLTRRPNPHLAFGIGPHVCPGAYLARLETATLLDVLRPHLATFELAGPIIRLESNFMNGIKSMPARFARRRESAPG